MPAGVRDPARPSGGNVYDVRVCAGLAARGWTVLEAEVPGGWPHADESGRRRLGSTLATVPEGDLVLIDGLVGSTTPETVAAQADRLRIGILVHMPLGHAMASSADAAEREQRVLAEAAVVVVTSEWTKTWLAKAYGLEPGRVHVAIPGVDPAPLSVETRSGNRLLAVGPVSYGKGHDTLTAALSQLGDLDWRLDMVGSLEVDPGTAERVRQWAGEAGGKVRLAGALTDAGLRAAYAATDLLVHPSRSETYGMVVTEALARGLPVLASDVGGTREAVGVGRFGTPGLLVAPGDEEALAAALRAWLTDAELRRRLRAAAAARRPELPSWRGTVDAVHRALLSTAAMAGASR
jgi:glycosyltransferase involved in cell wall biosynthesis